MAKASANMWLWQGLTSIVADGCWDGAQSLGISLHGQTLLASCAGSTLLHVLQQMMTADGGAVPLDKQKAIKRSTYTT